LALIFVAISLAASFQTPAIAAAPTVLNVTSSTANGIYGVGDQIDIAIQFSEVVTVTGTPTLTMRLSSTVTSNINYTSGSGTNTLTFRFTGTSATSTSDLDYAAPNSLSGTIKNSALEQATLTLPAPGASGSLGANKSISFESFGSHLVSTPTFQNNHLQSIVFSPSRDLLFVADGNNIVEVDLNLATKTTFLNTGATVNNLAIFGDDLYWTSTTGVFQSSVNNPSKSTLLTHSANIAAFSRTNNYWVIVDVSRGMYKYLDDGSMTKTFVTTLSSSIADTLASVTSMNTSPNSEKVLWRGQSTGLITEIDLSNGTTTTYSNLTKCSSSLRGMVRLGDGSEIYGAYSPTSILSRRWPDGRVTCSAVSYGPWMFGDLTATTSYLYASVYASSSSDYRILRFTPFSTSWGGIWSDGFSGLTTPSTITVPVLNGNGVTANKGTVSTLTVQVSVEGNVTFRIGGKYIPGCQKVATTSLTAACSWKPSVQGSARITATLKPNSNSYSSSQSQSDFVVLRRTTTR
jgi:hypothetical protein